MIKGHSGRKFVRAFLVEHLDDCVGKTLGELDATHFFESVSENNKGAAGKLIEYSVLLLPEEGSSDQKPDIEIDGEGYEVKTTGIEIKNGETRAKEPVSITAVSPPNIVKEKYHSSAFWHKVAHLLFFYYLYDSAKNVKADVYARFPLLSYQFHEYEDFSIEEQRTLENDWRIVRDFVAFLQRNYSDYESQ
jgi:hypothetical protein